MSDITDRIGEVSESIARTACERLREQGKIRSYLCVDTHGIDFLLITSCWQAMHLQVKTSWFGAKRPVRASKLVKLVQVPALDYRILQISIAMDQRD